MQARMGSTRLPGKILMPVLGKPLLLHEVERLRRCKLVDQIIIATSTLPSDDQVEEFCRKNAIEVFRGSESNVLSRYCDAVRKFKPDLVVRVTGDCPLIDPDVVDQTISLLKSNLDRADFSCNVGERTFPRGMDTEVFKASLLLQIETQAEIPGDFEHVTQFVHRQKEKFRILNLAAATNYSQYRLTVDTPEDFELIKILFEEISKQTPEFGLAEIVRFLENNPKIAAINAHIEQKKI